MTDGPLIVEHGLYSREQVMKLLRVASETLQQWQRDGLPVCCRGTKQYYFFGADVIDFLRAGKPNRSARRKGVSRRKPDD